MTRILTITNWYPPHHYGGYELECFDVMTRLTSRGHDVRVLCSDERFPGAAIPDTDHERFVHRELRLYWRDGDLYTPRFRERLELERHNQRVLERHLASHSPDMVAIWHMGAMSLGLLRALSERRLPIVYAVCDDWLTYIEKQDAWARPFVGGPARRFAGRVVEAITGVPTTVDDLGASGSFCFVSKNTRQRALAYSRWAYPVSTVIYSGIDHSQFSSQRSEAERPWQWRLLFTGRFERRKGIETLLRALPLLPPEATLRCYGRGTTEEHSRLVRLASELGVTDRVSFGRLGRHELAALYEDADVLVFPSEWEEPFGLVPIEAMACGTPVAATGAGGSGEFLRDGYNCVLFEAGDPIALADAVHQLHASPELRSRVVRGGFRTAERLDIESVTDAFEGWYMAAAEHYAHGRPADRELDLPTPGDDSSRARPSTERTRVVGGRLGDLSGLRSGDRALSRAGLVHVRVGIVSWNTAALLDDCLRALPAALAGVESRVVVVDNASHDGSATVAAQHPGVHVVRNTENVGYARAMNQALTGSDAEVLVALNPDTEPAPGSLAVLAHRLLEQADVGLVVPRLLNPDGTLQHSVFRFPSPRQAAAVLLAPRWLLERGHGNRWWAEGYSPHDRAQDIDWAIGAVHVIRASALNHQEPYDARWFMYVEDVDLCWRLACKGWRRRIEPDASVTHVGNAAGAQAWGEERTTKWMAATYRWYARTFGTAAMRRWAAVNVLIVCVHLVGALPRALLGQAKARSRTRDLVKILPVQVNAFFARTGRWDGTASCRPPTGSERTRAQPTHARAATVALNQGKGRAPTRRLHQ